jgi:hypothetical protein
MLKFLRNGASDRKLRLFACACCRLMDRCGNLTGLAVVELAEQVADGLLSLNEAVRQEAGVRRLFADSWALSPAPVEMARKFAAEMLALSTIPRTDLLRCLFLHPSRRVVLDPTWLAWDSQTVLHLARSIYEEHAFERMPILGDALEEAGCNEQTILAHCRGREPHARGCWVVDRLLGME